MRLKTSIYINLCFVTLVRTLLFLHYVITAFPQEKYLHTHIAIYQNPPGEWCLFRPQVLYIISCSSLREGQIHVFQVPRGQVSAEVWTARSPQRFVSYNG